jgi:uncharacterized membrane protein
MRHSAQNRSVPALVGIARDLENDSRLDRVADRWQPVADALVADPKRRDLLHGKQIGHALHPLLTDLPIGAWTSANLLDLFGGEESRPAARKLVGFGLLCAVPTVITGAAEWAMTTDGPRRVGVVHAGSNSVGFMLYGASWLARKRGNHSRGVGYALAGSLFATVGGFLGGHLAIGRKVGSRHPEWDS